MHIILMIDIVLFVAMVTMYRIPVDSLVFTEIEAPLDANKAAQFTSTSRAMIPAQIKQCYAAFLREEQTDIIVLMYDGFFKCLTSC